MRKFLLFAAVTFFGIGVQAASYGILVNNTTYYEAAAMGEKDYQDRDQFKASVSLNAGDVFCVYDKDNDAKFTIAMEEGEGSAKSSFTEGAESATCNNAGCYDFYIKLKWEDNSMWVQVGTDCNASGTEVNPGQGGGGGEGGEGGQGGGLGDAYWYYKGEVDKANLDNEELGFNVFKQGKATIDVENEGYIFLIYQVSGAAGVQYMTDGWLGFEVTHATMSNCGICNNGNKLFIPGGHHTLYLYDNGDGTYELSREELPGKKLVDGGEAIENVVYELDLNAPMFDLLGRKVTEDYRGVVIQNGHKFIR